MGRARSRELQTGSERCMRELWQENFCAYHFRRLGRPDNDKTKARAEEREKNIEWIKRLFTAWRVSHAERKEAGEDDPEEDETPVEIPPSAVTIYPKGTPVPTPTVEVQVLETRVDLTGRD